jgi:hypothetical protein
MYIYVLKKDINLLEKTSKKYQLFNNYYLRTPLFSFNTYKKFINKDNLDEKDFKEILNNTIFREAIFLASPELYTQIIKWEKGEITDKKKIEKLQFAIIKYFTRISTRCTPFGLFATCGAGEFEINTNIELKPKETYKRFTRFDTTFLNQLFQELLKKPIIKENVLFYSNTSIYRIGNHYRYVEYTLEKKQRSYALEGLVHSEYLEIILKEPKKGKTIKEMASLLIDDEITIKDAISFIDQLIDNQILVSELEITATGDDYFKNLLNKIKQIPEVSEIYNQLVYLEKLLTQLDTKIGNSIDVYKEITTTAKNLVPELDKKFLFQTDSFTSFKHNTLNSDIKKQLSKAFVLFNKMTLSTANGSIEQFKRDFLKRFEQSEVPLNLALDTETGIGYGEKKEDVNELLDDLSLFGKKKRYERVIWKDTDTILQKKLVIATQNKQSIIKLTEDDFKDLPIDNDDLPDTFSSIIEVYKTKSEEQIFIKGMGGASATCLLGRFSYGDKELEELIKEIVETEEKINNDKILAEIVHLPEARTGNILQRSSLRKYEIPYLGKSNVHQEHQIPLEDILVSVKNDEIILRCKKLQKEIIPRLGNAHNYGSNPLPIYQFLCELQTQNKRSSIGFSWNDILKQQPFLPRVEFENMIFSKALWSVEVKIFKKLFEKENLMLSIKNWRKQNLMPSFVELVEGDNKLLINLNNKTSIKMLLDIVKNRKQFLLEEFLFNDNEIIKDKERDSYCNQFVVSYYNEAKLKKH